MDRNADPAVTGLGGPCLVWVVLGGSTGFPEKRLWVHCLSGLGSPRPRPQPRPWPASLHSPSFICCLGYREGGTEVPGLACLSQYGGFLPRHPQTPWPPLFPLPPPGLTASACQQNPR